MKKLLLLALIGFTTIANAQLQKKDWLLGVDFGLNNQLKTSINEHNEWSANGSNPIGVNVAYMMGEKISLGYRFNLSMMNVDYDDGVSSFTAASAASSNNLYGTYHYINNEHFMMGSGLSLGYTTFAITENSVTLSETAFKADVVLADLKYIFKEKFGLNANVYLLSGFNTFGSLGLFWRL